MGEVTQALSEVKELYAKVFGLPAPEIGPSSYAPFPPGVDPIRHAVDEVSRLKQMSEQLKAAPARATWVPRADIFAARDSYVIRLEIPGVRRETLEVFLAGPECIVRGDRRPREDDEMRAINVEWLHGPFERRFTLPSNCLLDRVSARYVEGVLELQIAVEPATPPKEMKVEVA